MREQRLGGNAARRLGTTLMVGVLLSGGAVRGMAQSLAPEGAASIRAWEQLGDTTLNRLIDEAVQANPDVQSAAARVRGARAARLNAALDFAPTVTVAGGYTRQRLASASFPIGGGGAFPDQDIWDAGFDASWELDLFGRVRKNVRAQGQYIEAAREDLRDVRVTLSAEVARAYFELRGAQERLAVAERNAANQKATLDFTQQRLDAGSGTAFDTERANAQYQSTLASLPTLESQVAAAQYRIGVLVGRSPIAVAAELETAGPLPALPAATPQLRGQCDPRSAGCRGGGAQPGRQPLARGIGPQRVSPEGVARGECRLFRAGIQRPGRCRHLPLRRRTGGVVAGAQSWTGEGASGRDAGGGR